MLSIHDRTRKLIGGAAAALIVTGGFGLVAGGALAQPGTGVVIDINNPQRSKYPIAVPVATSGDPQTGKVIATVASFDMKVSGWFKPVDLGSVAGDLKTEGVGVDTARWKEAGAYGVIKYRSEVTGGRLTIDFKLYEVEKGDRAVLSRTYRGAPGDVRKLTHMWCNEVVKYFTGEPGFFGSRLAFSAKGGPRTKKVMAVDFDGYGAYSVTRNSSINILPAWSPSGGEIAFTSYMRANPDVYIASAGGGKPRRVSHYYGMNTGVAWSPDGSKLAVTLSKDGQPEVYIVSASDGKIIRRLTNNRAIDSGAAWSPNGSEIAFVSDREGGPQIFVMSADGSNQRRVSMNGSYNTTPSWNPRKGARQLAYTTRDGDTFDIVTLDLTSGKMVRITQNEGVNEEPSFSPNGRAIAFASHRPGGTGIYIASADGTGDAVMVWKGWSTSIDWGPTPAQ
ncbi:MAG TPA: Tol-Pal system beta propeller repeat protein TolB [Kofleriaceae bacterium]|nr:Tol-Pal system beta propeller repeat protein TolB [Kofleriaceae bacterium]